MFFIIGNPRSGTSLFRLLMTSHSRVHIPPECGFVMWWSEKHNKWKQDSNKHHLDLFLDDLFSAKKFEFWKVNREALKAYIFSTNPRNYRELCLSIYMYHANQAGKKDCVIGDKNNFHLNHIADLNKMFPSAKFVHIIRDGRDVATSYRSMSEIKSDSKYRPDLPVNMEDIASEWRKNITSVQEGFSQLDPSCVLEIRYEDLINNTRPTLKKVCTLIGLTYEAQMLEYYLANEQNRLEPTEFKPWKDKTFKKIDNTAIGKWKNLPEKDLHAFQNICGDVLETYGYELALNGNS